MILQTFCTYCNFARVEKICTYCTDKMKHAKIFKNLLTEESISQKWLSERSGMHPSKINRFLNGVQDINASELFELLNLMPNDFQSRYWQLVIHNVLHKKASEEVDAVELVKSLSPAKRISVMKAIVNSDNIFV